MLMNMTQKHPQCGPCSPHFSKQDTKEAWTDQHFYANHLMFPAYSPMASPQNQTGSRDDKEKRRRQHRNVPQSSQKNRQNRCRRVQPSGKGLRTIPGDVPLIQSPNPMIKRPPYDNDVVCLTISCPKGSKDVIAIQPGSNHQGNLRFCSMVRNYASSFDCSKDQKEIARTITAEFQSKGGRFLVWVKANPAMIEHSNNGSWQIVGTEDALNITRYVLLKQIEQLQPGSARYSVKNNLPPVASVQSKTSTHKAPEVDRDLTAKELDESLSNATVGSSSTATLLNIFAEMSARDEEDDLDLWSSSPGGENKEKKTVKPRLEANCWEYKLLLPLDLE